MRNIMPLLIAILLMLFSFCPLVNGNELIQLRPYAREISFTGFTRPLTELTIAAEISGTCTAVQVDVGDYIKDNGVVIEIDPTFIRLDLEKNKIEQEKTEYQLELQRKTLGRFKKLINKKSTAEATYDETVLKTNVLKLTLESLKNEEKRLQEQLKRHTLKAPLGWKVIERRIEPGEFIRQGEPLLRLGNFKALIVPFLLTYEELNLLRRMEKLTLYLPDLDNEIEAEIYRIAPDFDEKKRKILVDLRVASKAMASSSMLRGGLRALLKIDGKVEQDSFRVPHTALLSRYEAHWLVLPDGQQKNVILLGTTDDGKDAIINGGTLNTEDKFVANPGSYAKE